MKRIIFTKAKNTMQRASNLKVIGHGGLKRLQADINSNEYAVFVKPMTGRLKQVLHWKSDLETVESVKDVTQARGQDESDSRLVDEVFVRPAPWLKPL